MQLDWRSLFLGVIAALVIYNFVSLLRSVGQKRKAEAELRAVEGKIEKMKQEVEMRKKELFERLNKIPGPPKKPE